MKIFYWPGSIKQITSRDNSIQVDPSIFKVPVETLNRRLVEHSSIFYEKLNLRRQRRTAKGQQRIEINRKIRGCNRMDAKRKNSITKGPYREIKDLEGNLIGVLCFADEVREGLYITNKGYVGNIIPDITKQARGHCLRLSAYVTEEGRQYLVSAAKKHLKYQNMPPRSPKKSRSRRCNGPMIRRKLQNSKCYDMLIHGINVHINLNGKFEIFSHYKGLDSLLCTNEEGLSDAELQIFTDYTHHHQNPAWVRKTTPEFNLFVARSMNSLSEVAYELFK